jgi:hypothetical protein
MQRKFFERDFIGNGNKRKGWALLKTQEAPGQFAGEEADRHGQIGAGGGVPCSALIPAERNIN